MANRFDPGQKETSFSGKLYAEKDRDGNRKLVMTQSEIAAVFASAPVQAAATVADLRTALAAAFAALT